MVGHSMGGYTTLEFARQFPDMIKGFVLFHSHASADTEEARENRRRTINIVKLDKAGFIKEFIPDLFAEENDEKFADEIVALQKSAAETPPQGIIAALEAMRDRSGKIELLLNAQVPVLFIAGKEDKRIPVQNVMAQAILPKHAEVLILGNVGHMGFIEARNETLDMLKCFVRKTK
jgi:pimeloyl-ACP methyl ester carboxylesterase